MIVHIPGGNKDESDLFVDCTSKDTTPYLPITSGLNNKKALVLDPDNPRLIETPSYKESKAEVLVRRSVVIPEDLQEQFENLSVKEKITLNPYCASPLRGYLRAFEPKQRRKAFSDLLSQQANLRIDKLHTVNLDSPSEDLVIEFEYKVPDALHKFSRDHDEDKFVGTLPTILEDYLLKYELEEPRKTPFELTLPIRVSTSTRIHLPSQFRTDGLESTKPIHRESKFFNWVFRSERRQKDILIEAHIDRHQGKYHAESFL